MSSLMESVCICCYIYQVLTTLGTFSANIVDKTVNKMKVTVMIQKCNLGELNEKPLVSLFSQGRCSHNYYINPYHAEFLKWNNPPYIIGTFYYHFKDIKMRT